MNTLINISESILKIEMGTMKITIEVNNPPDTLVQEILESKTPIVPIVSAPKSDNTSEKITVKKVENKTEEKPSKKGHKQNRVALVKNCLYCNNEFTPTINAQKYCSPACRELNKQHQLDATLKQIEEKRDTPYEFAKRM